MTFGTRAFLPFRVASVTNGDPSGSPAEYIRIIEPCNGDNDIQSAEFFQTSPYNFGLFMNPVSLDNNGTYTIALVSLIEEGRRKRYEGGIYSSASVNVTVNCKSLLYCGKITIVYSSANSIITYH